MHSATTLRPSDPSLSELLLIASSVFTRSAGPRMNETSDRIDDELRLGKLDVVSAVQSDPMVAARCAPPKLALQFGPARDTGGQYLIITVRFGRPTAA
jgi:hypothetical protein